MSCRLWLSAVTTPGDQRARRSGGGDCSDAVGLIQFPRSGEVVDDVVVGKAVTYQHLSSHDGSDVSIHAPGIATYQLRLNGEQFLGNPQRVTSSPDARKATATSFAAPSFVTNNSGT